MRLIDADALMENIKNLPTYWTDGRGFYSGKYPQGMFNPEDVLAAINNAPTCKD